MRWNKPSPVRVPGSSEAPPRFYLETALLTLEQEKRVGGGLTLLNSQPISAAKLREHRWWWLRLVVPLITKCISVLRLKFFPKSTNCCHPRSKSSSPIPSFCSIAFPSYSFLCGAGGFTDARPSPAPLTPSGAQYGKKASTITSLTANPRLFWWPPQKSFLCYTEVRLPRHLRPVLKAQFWSFPVFLSELIQMKSISSDINYNLNKSQIPSGMMQRSHRACRQKYIL